MEIQERLNAEEITNLYHGRQPKTSQKLPEIVQLNVSKNIKERINAIAQKASLLLQEKTTSVIETIERNGRQTSYIPIIIETVDPSIPLTFFIFKSIQKDTITGEKTELVHFNLLKEELKGESMSDIWEEYKQAQDISKDGGLIGGMKYEIKGDTFNLKDRFINPKFRRQGIGELLLNGSETLIQQKATDTQAEQTAFAKTAQIDVICWLWNKGYRPQTPDDQTRFEQIVNGDKTLCMGENLYIFQQSVPEEKRRWENFRDSYRIKLERKFQPALSKGIEGIQDATKKNIRENTQLA